jgi:hypothetical protein
MSSGTLYEYLEKEATTIPPSARIGLVSRFFTLITCNKDLIIIVTPGRGHR